MLNDYIQYKMMINDDMVNVELFDFKGISAAIKIDEHAFDGRIYLCSIHPYVKSKLHKQYHNDSLLITSYITQNDTHSEVRSMIVGVKTEKKDTGHLDDGVPFDATIDISLLPYELNHRRATLSIAPDSYLDIVLLAKQHEK